MTCKEIMLAILQHQTEAFMYHDQLADYFKFLTLECLSEKHEEQAEKEFEDLRELKNCFIKEFNQLPYYNINTTSIYPAEWANKTSFEIDELTLKELVKNTYNKYLERETNTLNLYKNYAKELKENMNYKLSKKVCKQIKNVEEEIDEIKDWILTAQKYNYDLRMYK